MFTEEQLNQLREVIKAETEPLKQGVQGLRQDMQEVKTRLDSAEKTQRDMKRILTRVAKDVKYISGSYDERIISNRRRIERLEEHTGINKN